MDEASDSLYKAKNDLLGTALTKRTYRLMADLTDEATFKFFSWCRFVEFSGDLMVLVQAKIKDEKMNKNKDDEDLDSDDEGPA